MSRLGLALALTLAACSSNTPPASAPPDASTDTSLGPSDAGLDAPSLLDATADAGALARRNGVSYSPRGLPSPTLDDINAFYADRAPYGSVVAYHFPWRDTRAQSGQVPKVVASAMGLAKAKGFVAALGTGFSDGAGKADIATDADATEAWTNADARARFLQMVTALAAERPRFLFLGNETNTYFLTHTPAEWAAWISLFGEAYDAVKARSPETFVFTVFQLEHLYGLGRKNGWKEPEHTKLLDEYGSKIDGFGFTTYPYFEYDRPDDIPADYYTRLAARAKRPVVFTEVGWIAGTGAPYAQDEARQSAFVGVFFARTAAPLDVRYATWAFMWDVAGFGPAFDGIGLRNAATGMDRPAAAAWKARVVANGG